MMTTDNKPYIRVENLKKYFSTKRGMLHAVDDVSFDIEKGETLGLVGESGCGKSTLGRCLIRLLDSTAGKVLFQDREGGGYTDVTKVNASTMKELRRRVQIVFQDPYSCLNPRLSVWELIAEPLIVNNVYGSKAEMRKRIRELMSTVGLAERLENSYPHELDGGRRQRIGIARSLALNPEFIVLDEPVSALDVCIQAQILNLLNELQREFHYTYVFISHNLSVVKHVSDRGDVPGAGRRALRLQGALHDGAASLYPGAPLGHSRGAPGREEGAHHPGGRRSEPHRAPGRLPLHGTLPVLPGHLPSGDPALAGTPARASRGLSLRGRASGGDGRAAAHGFPGPAGPESGSRRTSGGKGDPARAGAASARVSRFELDDR